MLKEIVPRVERVGLLFSPESSPGGGSLYTGAVHAVGQSSGVKTIDLPIRNLAEIERAVDGIALEPNSGLLVLPDTTTLVHRESIIRLAAHYKLPAMYAFPFDVKEGGLFSYGDDQVDAYRAVAAYVDGILKGAKPADLPVQAPTKYTLSINLKTAKAPGIEISPTMLSRADEVIE